MIEVAQAVGFLVVLLVSIGCFYSFSEVQRQIDDIKISLFNINNQLYDLNKKIDKLEQEKKGIKWK